MNSSDSTSSIEDDADKKIKKENSSQVSHPITGARKPSRDPKISRPERTLDVPGAPVILPRNEHTLSRKDIDDDCLKVIRRLNKNGYQAFLVGGGVRDILLGKKPKDFDLSTSATPEEVSALFRNSRIIGRRFRLNHVYFRGGKILEVSTFRRSSEDDDEHEDELENYNLHGDAETDAFRRDLTINGLFYDLDTFSVVDYVGGLEDLKNGVVRIIGDPTTRFKEDPVRMIRAIRHAARAGFKIEEKSFKAICDNAELIADVSPARVYEECIKDMCTGSYQATLKLLYETGLLEYLLPVLNRAIKEHPEEIWESLDISLPQLDSLITKSKVDVTPALVFTLLFFGNLPVDVFESFDEHPEGAMLASVWDYSSEDVEEDSGLDTDTEIAFLKRKLKETKRQPGRRSNNKDNSTLYISVSEIVEGLIVPRKERERIKKLLFSRRLMILDSEATTAGFEERSFFKEALFLLQCTAQNEREDQALDAWSQKKVSKVKRKSPNRKGPNKKGPNRKGPNKR